MIMIIIVIIIIIIIKAICMYCSYVSLDYYHYITLLFIFAAISEHIKISADLLS